MTKLSELLEYTAAVMCSVDVGFPTSGMPIQANIYRQRAAMIRAITPALVELVAAHDVREQRTEAECVNAIHRINAAAVALSEAMEKAGVTCE